MSEDIRDIVKAIEVMRSGGPGVAPGGIRDNILRDRGDVHNQAFDTMAQSDPDLDIMMQEAELAKGLVYKAISDGMSAEEIIKTFGPELIKSIFLPHMQSVKHMGKALNKKSSE